MLNSLFYNRLYDWYEIHRRILPWRETDDGYAIWLSEVILQQTRVVQGMDYYMRFIARWPRVEDLAEAAEEEVLREWQGLGYYSRARNLHKAAKIIVEKGWTPFPKKFEDIRSLPGIGDYTAGAIASFAYDHPYPAMDGNVYRVVARLLDIDEAFDTTAGKKLFRAKIEEILDRAHPRLFNSAIMEFGALYCVPKVESQKSKVESHSFLEDRCDECPLADFCAAHAHGTAELLPIRKPRPKVRDRWFEYHIYICRSREINAQNTEIYTLLRKREDPKDIWYHLYEFPCEESAGWSEESNQSRGENPLSFTHILSHQRIHARFIVHQVNELPAIDGGIAIPWPALDDYALSRLTLRAIEKLPIAPAPQRGLRAR